MEVVIMLLSIINLFLLFYVIIRYKKTILKYFRYVFNIKIILLSLFLYFTIVFLIGIIPMYR